MESTYLGVVVSQKALKTTATRPEWGGYEPACCVALEIFALALQEPGANLLGGNVILTGIMNLLWGTDGDGGINNLIVVGHKVNPLLILGHGYGAIAELLDDVVGVVCLALEDSGVSIVGLLDLANHNGLELAARGLEVEIGLRR